MSLSRRTLLSALAGAAVLPGAALSQPALRVVATTGMIADAAQAIGGDALSLQALMGPGVDPHSYRQTRSDIVAMTRADLVLWNGHSLEAQLEQVLQTLAKRTEVVAVAEATPADLLIRHADYDGKADPHLWIVPDYWRHTVGAVRDALSAAQPASADLFAANAEQYLAQIDRVGGYARDTLTSVPATQRVLVTAHDAFGYLGRAYGYDVLGIQGISTESEAGLARIGSLVDTLVSRSLPSVFVESSVTDRNVRALIEGAGAQGHAVAIGGELFSDAMGAPGTYEGTYVGMIDHNATTIARALGGSAPERGMDGKLAAGA